MGDQSTYTFAEDYYEDRTDGQGRRKLFSAGAVISWATAYELGVVTTKTPPKDEAEKPAKKKDA